MVDASKLGVALAALAVGGILGAAAALALLNVNIASITAQVVPSSSGGGGGSGGNATQPLITIDLGTLEAGRSYYFDDVYGEAQLYTETGGPVTFYIDFNSSVFEYVKVKVEVEYYNGYDDSEEIAEFYLDSASPSYTVDLPADTYVKVKVEVERITVAADAAPGMYTILVAASG